MDKNSITGLVIIGLILFGFSWYGANQEKKVREERAVIDSMARVEAAARAEIMAEEQPQVVEMPDSVREVSIRDQRRTALGDYLYEAQRGVETFYRLENDLLTLTLSNKGGRVAAVELKDYKTYDGDPLYLFHEDNSRFNLSFFTNQVINTGLFYFTPVTLTDAGEGQSMAYRLYADSLSYIEYLYAVQPGSYQVDFRINLVGMERWINPSQTDLGIQWETVSPQQERGFEYENNYTTIAYLYPGESSREELSFSTGTKEETVKSKIRWVAFKQQFFSSILVAENDFQNGTLKYETFQPGSGNIKQFTANLSIPYTPQTTQYDFSYYFGPNKYTELSQYGEDFQTLVPLGWGIFGFINRWIVIPVFNLLGSRIASYGLIILILTIFIKLIIFPFTYKSYLSMAKMRLLKPEMDQLNEKYPNKEDAMKKQQAMMEIYRSAGVNPMGGCLPLLFQMPILIAMFRFFPASIELRQQSFLWANDLSSYDSILQLPFNIPFYGDHVSLFALLMGLSVFVSSKLNYAQSNMSSNQMPGMTFMTLYMMPILLILWFNNYSSGLSYYYLLSNLITIGQMYGMRAAVNDAKLHAQMKSNAKKPKKKGKFAQRYEAMVKQQQEMARQQQKNKK